MKVATRVLSFGVCTAFLAASSGANAQQATGAAAYPAKPIRFIIPFPSGGTTDVAARITSEGAMPVGNTSAEFAAFVRQEIAKWAKVVKASGARAD